MFNGQCSSLVHTCTHMNQDGDQRTQNVNVLKEILWKNKTKQDLFEFSVHAHVPLQVSVAHQSSVLQATKKTAKTKTDNKDTVVIISFHSVNASLHRLLQTATFLIQYGIIIVL